MMGAFRSLTVNSSRFKLVKVMLIIFLLMNAQASASSLTVSRDIRKEVICVSIASLICDGETEKVSYEFVTGSSGFSYSLKVSKVGMMGIRIKKNVERSFILRLESESRLGCVNLIPKSPLIEITNLLSGLRRRSRRSRLEIYAQILRCLRFNSLSLNEIAFYAGLNYKMAKKHVDFLLAKHLINTRTEMGKHTIAYPEREKNFLSILRRSEG